MGKHSARALVGRGRRRVMLAATVATLTVAATVGAGIALSPVVPDTQQPVVLGKDAVAVPRKPVARINPEVVSRAEPASPRIVRATTLKRKDAPDGHFRVDPDQEIHTDFNVSSFNVLGFSHTIGGRRGRTDGVTRTGFAVNLLRQHDVSVAGLQEFQEPQYAAFRRMAPEYDVYPGMQLGSGPVQNSIVWQTDDWALVEAATSPIPYFHGNRIAMPHVLLEHRRTAQRLWVMNYHNPADVAGDQSRWRAMATQMQGTLAARLSQSAPVVMLGDFNDRAAFFCHVSRLAPLTSANGGTRSGSACLTPDRMEVDWILGSTSVGFDGYVADRSSLVERTTDHAMVRAGARITGRRDLSECRTIAGWGTFCPNPSTER